LDSVFFGLISDRSRYNTKVVGGNAILVPKVNMKFYRSKAKKA